MKPGRRVASPRSMSVAAAGIGELVLVETDSILFPVITTTGWSTIRPATESNSLPARITTVGEDLVSCPGIAPRSVANDANNDHQCECYDTSSI